MFSLHKIDVCENIRDASFEFYMYEQNVLRPLNLITHAQRGIEYAQQVQVSFC